MSNSAITIDGTGSGSSAALFAGRAPDTARTVSIHRSWSSLETVSKQWNDWQQNPNADPEFVKFILGIRPECEHPYAIAIQKGRQLEALMVGRVEHPRVSIKVGYLQVA